MDSFDFDLLLEDEFDAVCVEYKKTVRPPICAKSEMEAKYPAKLHARKVAHELGVSGGLIYLPGEPERLYEDSDMGPTFRQRRYFYYVSGANFPDCAVTYDVEADSLVLWIPFVEPRQVLWYGRTPGIAECLRRSDVDDVRYAAQLPRFLAKALTPDTTLYVLHPDQMPPLETFSPPQALSSPVQSIHLSGSGSAAAGTVVDATALRPAMDAARVIKTSYEVAAIRRANAVSSAAHRLVARRLRTTKTESEIDVVFTAACALRGGRRQAYPVIAAAGTNASTLHYGDNNASLKGTQLVVLDAGCEWNCYASDITRTLPVGGRFATREARAVCDLVGRMQDAALEVVAPGNAFRDAHLRAARVGTRGLLELGVLRGPEDDVWAAGTVAAFFPHGLGHHVGLEVHDVSGPERLLVRDVTGLEGGKREPVTASALAGLIEAAAAEAKDESAVPPKGRQLLREGMVITVEPGIYFCREYIEGYFLTDPKHSQYIDADRLEAFYPVGGSRIEDDVLVVRDGYENLTTAPKGQELWDIINRGGDGAIK